jgi:predicted nucleic acid-binding protein
LSPFFDTNVLVYAFLDVEKRGPALEALAQGGVISAQVLNEFTRVAHKKRRRSWPEIEAALVVIRDWFRDVVPITSAIHAAAVALARDHSLAFYDALILAAAIEADCETLYSEDFQHGRRFGDLTIVNPFLEGVGG